VQREGTAYCHTQQDTHTHTHVRRHTHLILGCHIGSGLNQYESNLIVPLDNGEGERGHTRLERNVRSDGNIV
jgi:hypothetical protein